jgi:hypothetical protein
LPEPISSIALEPETSNSAPYLADSSRNRRRIEVACGPVLIVSVDLGTQALVREATELAYQRLAVIDVDAIKRPGAVPYINRCAGIQ